MEITKDTVLQEEVKVYAYCIYKYYNIPKIKGIFEGTVTESGYFFIPDKKLRNNYLIGEYARKFTTREEAVENFKLDLAAYIEELDDEFEKEVQALQAKIDKKKKKSKEILEKLNKL